MVDWYGMVWHKKQVPRWTFIQWLALLGRLQQKTGYMFGESPMIVTVCCLLGEWNRMTVYFFNVHLQQLSGMRLDLSVAVTHK